METTNYSIKDLAEFNRALNFEKGERINHKVFGQGTITDVVVEKEGAATNRYVVVDFDNPMIYGEYENSLLNPQPKKTREFTFESLVVNLVPEEV